MAGEALLGRIRHDWLGGVASSPRLESPTTRCRVFVRILDHDWDGLADAFLVGAVLERDVSNIVDENRSVWIWSRASKPQPVQSSLIHVDKVNAGDEAK